MADDRAAAALRTLADAAVCVGRQTTSMRIALAHLHGAVDPELLPPRLRGPVARELADAAARASTPLAAGDVARVLRSAWGAEPTDVLDDLDLDRPVAVTPGAQVHRATLDGAAVAVKVLRPGLAELVRADLRLLDALVRPLGAALPAIDAGAVLAEIRERVSDELDLEHEGSTQRAVHRALRRHPTLSVPAVHSDLTHEGVLVTTWAEGPTLAEQRPADAGATARALVAFFVGAARAGTLHADPHPGNVLLGEGPAITVVDFGAARRVTAVRVDLAVAALAAFSADDAEGLAAALAALGWLGEAAAREAHALGRELLAPFLHGPARLDAAAVRAVNDGARPHAAALAALARQAGVPAEDLWPLRMLAGLFALLAGLGATEDWPALVLAAARDGW